MISANLDHNWLVISFLAPMFWALVNTIDVYFVDGIYRDELDGVIISGVFQILPWPVILLLTSSGLPSVIGDIFSKGLSILILLPFAGGFLYTMAFYFYFKTLFGKNDVSMLQVIWNLTVVAVPILSFFIFKEILPFNKYFGMAVALSGAVILAMGRDLRGNITYNYLCTMFCAVILLSLSMVFCERSYNVFSGVYDMLGFWAGFLFFSLGSFCAGALFSFFFRRNPLLLIKKYYKIFILAEGIYFMGNLCSQRALDTAPSASYVAVIETFVPVFVLVYSLLIIFLLPSEIKNANKAIEKIYSEQTKDLWVKGLATFIMAIGVYIIS